MSRGFIWNRKLSSCLLGRIDDHLKNNNLFRYFCSKIERNKNLNCQETKILMPFILHFVRKKTENGSHLRSSIILILGKRWSFWLPFQIETETETDCTSLPRCAARKISIFVWNFESENAFLIGLFFLLVQTCNCLRWTSLLKWKHKKIDKNKKKVWLSWKCILKWDFFSCCCLDNSNFLWIQYCK